MSLTIWCNADLPDAERETLRREIGSHRLIFSAKPVYNLGVSAADPLLAEADVAFGQPDPDQIIALPRLKWVQLTTAGYTRYDREDLRTALRARGAALTNSSGVYAEPCAEHALAMMLALARQLPQALMNQHKDHGWPALELRMKSHLLCDQTALIVGFGAIGRRIAELLEPFRMNIIAVRRKPRGDEPVRCVPESRLDDVLPQADHVIDTLPASPATEKLFDAHRLARLKASAIFYNIGRGSTVDQNALRAMLERGALAAAYLDVMTPEPLPPDDPLWRTPNCFITPHTAGGAATEYLRLVRHFIDNLGRFERGEALVDRVI